MHKPVPPQLLRTCTVENGGLAERQVGGPQPPILVPYQRGTPHRWGTTTAMKGPQTAAQPSCGPQTHLNHRARVEPRPTGLQWVQRQRLLWGRVSQKCHFSRAAKWVHGPSRFNGPFAEADPMFLLALLTQGSEKLRRTRIMNFGVHISRAGWFAAR